MALIQTKRANPILSNHMKLINGSHLPVSYGGTITGNIGMGKSTLRLHLLEYLKSTGYQIYDFDFKGETAKYLIDKSSVITPGINCQINVFELFVGNNLSEVVLSLANLFEMNSEDLTPPQKNLLKDVLWLTLSQKGNYFDFINNIHYLGNQPEDKAVYTDKTSQALVDRLSWFIYDLRSVFSCHNSSFDLNSHKSDYFFDLSHLKQITTLGNVKKFIDTMLFLISRYEHANKKMIFIEEVQILLQDDNIMIEEIITTLRNRNIGIFLCGTQLRRSSPLLFDSGLHFQFHTNFPSVTRFDPINLKPYQLILSSTKGNEMIFDLLPFQSMINNKHVRITRQQTQSKTKNRIFEVRKSILLGMLNDVCPTNLTLCNATPVYLKAQEFNVKNSRDAIRGDIINQNIQPKTAVYSYFCQNLEAFVNSKVHLSSLQYKNWVYSLKMQINALIEDLEREFILTQYTKD